MRLRQWVDAGIDVEPIFQCRIWTVDTDGIHHMSDVCSTRKGAFSPTLIGLDTDLCGACLEGGSFTVRNLVADLLRIEKFIAIVDEWNHPERASAQGFANFYAAYQHTRNVAAGECGYAELSGHRTHAGPIRDRLLEAYRTFSGEHGTVHRADLQRVTERRINGSTSKSIRAQWAIFVIPTRAVLAMNRRARQPRLGTEPWDAALGAWWRDDIEAGCYIFHGPRHIAEQVHDVIYPDKVPTSRSQLATSAPDEDPMTIAAAVILWDPSSPTFNNLDTCMNAARLLA